MMYEAFRQSTIYIYIALLYRLLLLLLLFIIQVCDPATDCKPPMLLYASTINSSRARLHYTGPVQS